MLDALAETWLINNRVNLKLLDGLSDEGLAATLSSRGGRTVGQQLAHLCWLRRYKLERSDKSLAAGLPEIGREQGDDAVLLRDVFVKSGEAYASLIRSCTDGKVKGFKRGIVAFTGYLIAHEAHHRGHILLTLKQCGIARPEALKMGLWEWNKL